jgi:hypothetical protein
MKNIIFVIVLVCAIQCEHNDDLHRHINFVNNADYKIWVADAAYYSDTITDIPGYSDIMPNSSRDITEPGSFEKLVEGLPNKEVLIIVKKDDPFIIDRKYILSIDSLNILGWKVNYP